MKEEYNSIVAFADLNALEFFKKQGFLEVAESTKQSSDLRRVIELCDESLLMAYKLPNFTITAQIQVIEKPSTELNRLSYIGMSLNYSEGARSRLDVKVAEFKQLVDDYDLNFRVHRIHRTRDGSKFKPKCFLAKCK